MDALPLRFDASGLQVVELPGAAHAAPNGILLGVHRRGERPDAVDAAFDILLTVEPDAPRPWVSVAAAELDTTLSELAAAVARAPVAATVLAQVLRLGAGLPLGAALVLESLAYSTLLAGVEFKAWRAATPVRSRPETGSARVRLARQAGTLAITLTRPEARNAVDAAMRDALVEALAFAVEDPDRAAVLLTGEGPCFSAGGDLDEFGQATDPAAAHAIRVAQSPARLLHALGDRASARLHGACIGAGVEIPAAAAHVVATPDAWFRLPEIAMGLIPGAGGTATLPPRIGRRRTCFMALSGCAIDARTALAWGLVDALEASP